MFLVGGPAYSGTTLLALLLNQKDVVCLDEPDFGKPAQSHRGIPVLEDRFPDVSFPPVPSEPLRPRETLAFLQACAEAVQPNLLGMKTCNSEFVALAGMFREAGYPVVGILRDIRDALVTPLPSWIDESNLNDLYRVVWRNRGLFDVSLRYEDLVRTPEEAMRSISLALSRDLIVPESWEPGKVHASMLKSSRHELLRAGSISTNRVGLWRTAERLFSAQTHETARMMGYDA